MDIQFFCFNCGKSIAIDEAGAGLTVQCPKCCQSLVVPAQTAKTIAIPSPRLIPTMSESQGIPPGSKKHWAAPPTSTPAMAQGMPTVNKKGWGTPSASPPTPATPKEIQTNVKQGALIGGWVSFIVTAICLITPFPTFFLWIPLGFAAFILSIVAMSQRRVLGGLFLLLVTIIGGPILWLYGTYGLGKNVSEVLRTSANNSTASLKAASESPAIDRTRTPVHPVSQTEATPPPAANIPVETNDSTQELTAIDTKGGFRMYRLGAKKTDINSTLTNGSKSKEDSDEYWVETFDHRLGNYQIESILLSFDHTLGILARVNVFVKGKNNIGGILEAFKAAYGEPVMDGGFVGGFYRWSGADITLRYHVVSFSDEAIAAWESKKINKLIETERDSRAKLGATKAAKDL